MMSSFDITKLHSLLKDFYNLTKIRITIFNDNFQELTSYPTEIPPGKYGKSAPNQPLP